MIAAPPVVIALPYLPVKEPLEFSGWWLGSLEDFTGPWLSEQFEDAARRFLCSFRDPSTKEITSTSLLARISGGADGRPPNSREQLALQLSIGFSAIHQNPYWTEANSWDSWRVATTDNAELWIQPLDLDGGWISLGRGGRVSVTAGGLNLNQDQFFVPTPLELHLPSSITLDEELLAAIYTTLVSPPDGQEEKAATLRVAMRWLLKAWQNTPSITWEDRLVYLKIAAEALTGEDNTFESAKRLQQVFEDAPLQEGGDLGLDDLLWSPGEPTLMRGWRSGGAQKEAEVPQFVHWCCSLGDARNALVHGEDGTDLEYFQNASPYNGPFVEIADRVVREAICVLLGTVGFPEVWRRGISRASFHAFRRLQEDSGNE